MNSPHDLPDLDLNLIAVFDALLRERSVTDAGKSLGLTQSAMSHSLKRLRSFFDDALFVKTTEGMMPTAKAAELGPVVLGVMEAIRGQVLSQASFDPLQARRTFNLCMSDMGELVFAPSLFAKLKLLAPHCKLHTLQVTPDALENVLSTGKADLALGSVRHASQGLYQEELFKHTFVSIVSVKNKAVGDTITREEFCAMPHIAVTLTGHTDTPYDSALEDAGIRRNIVLSTPHFLFLPLMLDQHPEFIATVPRALGTVFARHNVVKVLETPVPLPKFSLQQYWHPRFHHDRASIWLRGVIKSTFSELPMSMR
ncbi:LysR family transcriptional regulator [Variovorax paradoxus]|uniref:LysR family transcriptional regulator n=1 Tax=Variovorax paradoxus TaxID=34073 RepID=UPI003ECF7F52